VAEVFLDFAKMPIEPATAVRSTLILTGIQVIRSRNLFERYSDVLSPSERTQILGLAGLTWVPVEIALQHYTAADRLGLDERTIELIGQEVASRSWKHVLAPTFGRSKRIGPKPWDAFQNARSTVALTWHGSDVQILKEGPNQALYTWAGQPCAAIPYFVRSWKCIMRAVINLFALHARAELVPELSSPTAMTVRLSWVERLPAS
jgi:hypothetical protein